VIVASKGPRSPGRYYNLTANPDVEIKVGPKRFGVTARPVLPSDPDLARLWQIAKKNFGDHYEAYQSRTSRPIPALVLTPR
jgi:deazaflavin-dependent oxidoreductase (nitroreductase family)